MPHVGLNALTDPQSVAIIGASRTATSLGGVVARNMFAAGFEGPVLPVTADAQAIGSTMAYPDVASLPQTPDLAVVCTPPGQVLATLEALGARGVRAAVVLTQVPAGIRVEAEIASIVRRTGMRVLGPNSVGVMVPRRGLNASYAPGTSEAGSLGFVSQSGTVMTSVLDWAGERGIGFSHLVSLGDMADIDFADVIELLTFDHRTHGILLYVEAVRNARRFMSAARAAARVKPVVVIRGGRHEAAARAATSHSGALAGSDAVYDAAFRRAGMLRAAGLEELFDAAETLASRPQIRGPKIAVLTNGGGVGILAVDRMLDEGGALAALSTETGARLDQILPPQSERSNPVDLTLMGTGKAYGAATEALLLDEGIDAILVINCPSSFVDAVEPAAAVVEAIARVRKARNGTGQKPEPPVFTAWLGDSRSRAARELFADHQVASYDSPGLAAKAMMDIIRYQRAQTLLVETPPPGETVNREIAHEARRLVQKAVQAGRERLTEEEAKRLCRLYGIPLVESVVAHDPESAGAAALAMGFPVALKIASPDIPHKTDVGGVALGLDSTAAVRAAADQMLTRVRKLKPEAEIEGLIVQPMVARPQALELIVGMTDDATFGPVIVFGRGGTAVEVIRDKAIALPPLNRLLTFELMARTQIFRLLEGFRDRPAADLPAIADLILRVAELAADVPEIAEIDLNPLLADSDGVIAVDARVRIAPARSEGDGRFAVRPYPKALETTLTDRHGTVYPLRPIRPEDAHGLQELIRASDPNDVRMRFFTAFKELPEKMAARLSQLDYDREMAFCAMQEDKFAGVVRLAEDSSHEEAEYAVMVRSDRKGTGLGWGLMNHIIAYGRTRGLKRIYGEVLAENEPMLLMCEELGFRRKFVPDDPGVIRVVLEYGAA